MTGIRWNHRPATWLAAATLLVGSGAAPSALADCNANGRADELDIPAVAYRARTAAWQPAGAFAGAPGEVIGDDLLLTHGGTLYRAVFTVYNDFASPAAIETADLALLFYDLSTGTQLGTLELPDVTLNIAPGEFVIVDTGPLSDSGIVLPARVVAALEVTDVADGALPGQIVVASTDVGSSDDSFFHAIASEQRYANFGGAPAANFLWELTVVNGSLDCNDNGVPDDCDIAAATSTDCDANGVPDECEDCDRNGRADSCDIAADASADCNDDGILDACQAQLAATEISEDPQAPFPWIKPQSEYIIDTDLLSLDLPTPPGWCWEAGDGLTGDVIFRYAPSESDYAQIDVRTLPGQASGVAYAALLRSVSADPAELALSAEYMQVTAEDCNTIDTQFRPVLTTSVSTDWVYWIRVGVSLDATSGFVMRLDAPAAELKGDCNLNGILDACEPDCDADGLPDDCESDADFNGVPDDCLIGDVNCDGTVDTFDIDAFVVAISSADAFASSYPGCFRLLADANGDGEVDTFDVDAFVALLSPGG